MEKYLDETLSLEERADDLTARLTVKEKVEQGDAGNEFGSGDKRDLRYPAIQ